MALELLKKIKKSDEKILGRLAGEFGDDFLERCNGNKRIIGLYGMDEKTLDFFKDEIRNYLLENGKNVQVIFGEKLDNIGRGFFRSLFYRKKGYNIDVGYFLKGPGYFKNLNNGFLIIN